MKERTKRPHIKAAARDAIGVSIIRSGRRFCNFAGCQQLVEWAPVSGMPICGRRRDQEKDKDRHRIVMRYFAADGHRAEDATKKKTKTGTRS